MKSDPRETKQSGGTETRKEESGLHDGEDEGLRCVVRTSISIAIRLRLIIRESTGY